MRFGSVKFFKVLIKTVLAIAFFVPLILCVIFGVVLYNTNSELERVRGENERLTFAAEILTKERTPDVESFYGLYSSSGHSDEELIEYINSKHGGDLSVIAPTDNTPGITGITGETGEAAQTGNPADTSETTAETAAEPTAETSETAESTPESIYAALYPDMTVTPPEEYVREEGTVYLTFDDGPSDHTYSILAYLKQYNVKATFFVVPRRTEYCYETLRAIAADGHTIGVHSASHEYEKIYASVEAYLDDFHEAWEMIYEATGIRAELFRFPGGSKNDFNEATRDAIAEEMTRRGFRFFDWNVDSNDAGGANWTQMYNSVPEDISGNYRSVVLMHDSATTKNTVWVLEDILKLLISEGYKLDSINNDTQPVQFIGPFA
ncbi:MAG: polysaccharide deacetylase family protein [Oscillospiraceae bacterium]